MLTLYASYLKRETGARSPVHSRLEDGRKRERENSNLQP